MLVEQMAYDSNMGQLRVGIPYVFKPHQISGIFPFSVRVTSGASGVEKVSLGMLSCVQEDWCIWCPTEDIGSTKYQRQFRGRIGQTILVEHKHLIVIQLRRLPRPQGQGKLSCFICDQDLGPGTGCFSFVEVPSTEIAILCSGELNEFQMRYRRLLFLVARYQSFDSRI